MASLKTPEPNHDADFSGPVATPIVQTRNRLTAALVWVIPLFATLLGLVLILKPMLEYGPTITISFKTAEGIEPGETKVKYKNVDIGEVKRVRLSQDLSHVLADVELSRQAKNFAVADTCFWVVRPRIAANGVSGLNTLVSGAYIGVDAGTSKRVNHKFIGLETPPIITGDQQGHQFVLHSDNLGSLDIGSPVFYRRVQVGQVIAYTLDQDGEGVTLRIFVNAPYDKYVNLDSRFWHASGIDVRFDQNGLKLNTQSFAALMTGGIAFETPPSHNNAQGAPNNTTFRLSANASDATHETNEQPIHVVLNFNQTLRGLTIGAPVDFRGIVLGRVEAINLAYASKQDTFRMPVTLALYPARLSQLTSTVRTPQPTDSAQLLGQLVKRGLRAQLRPGNLLTGQLYIALDFFPKAPAAALTKHLSKHTDKAVFELPTVPSTLGQLQIQVADIMRKLDKVPFDQIGGQLNSMMRNANRLFKQLDTYTAPQATRTLASAQQTFQAAEATLQQDSPLQSDIHQALTELTRSLQSLNTLADYLARHPEAFIRGKAREES